MSSEENKENIINNFKNTNNYYEDDSIRPPVCSSIKYVI